MKVCDLCGDTKIVVGDGDVHLCKKCKDKLEKESKEIKKIEEQIDNALRISKETRDIYIDI